MARDPLQGPEVVGDVVPIQILPDVGFDAPIAEPARGQVVARSLEGSFGQILDDGLEEGLGAGAKLGLAPGDHHDERQGKGGARGRHVPEEARRPAHELAPVGLVEVQVVEFCEPSLGPAEGLNRLEGPPGLPRWLREIALLDEGDAHLA